jgi:hypothetical protein
MSDLVFEISHSFSLFKIPAAAAGVGSADGELKGDLLDSFDKIWFFWLVLGLY